MQPSLYAAVVGEEVVVAVVVVAVEEGVARAEKQLKETRQVHLLEVGVARMRQVWRRVVRWYARQVTALTCPATR
jgi:hypothetical protein